jgi:hypothetical protein
MEPRKDEGSAVVFRVRQRKDRQKKDGKGKGCMGNFHVA